ncbi:enoyl-CoA hydratase [Phenylobacterium sp.]|jgi:enoyl-CoA hydratase/carnithine racemase|uniref:enoyl-CoA hydratase n=1 Tax=Phenylobacterium sp. TaxID=1871053 RepID=UPI002E36F4F5|nr:enoyl-CoA hydratase [Phenylobacterium sp.]HEX3367793.1 enoyl-CoA hydratase [Phenylobacterium sp.]
MISYVTVRHETRARGRVAIVTIDNQKKLNSLSSGVMAEFVSVFADLAAERDLRAVVLTGAGDKAFIGGANIDEMAALPSPAAARAFILKVHGCCRAIRDLPVPVIAAINGWCLGAGMEIAAACDMRLAAETAIFGMPEVKLGLPSVVEAALLPSLIGWGRTRRILMTGETFSAADAAAWGLVEETHPPALLFAAAEALLDLLLEAEPRAARIQKALIRAWEDLPVTAGVAAGVDAFEDAWTTDEPATSMARFLAERAAAKGR